MTPTNALEVHFNNTIFDGIKVVNNDAMSSNGFKYLYLGVAGTTADPTISKWDNAGVVESATDGGLILGAYATGAQIKFQLSARSVDAMVIDANGSVGIGVPFGANPTSKLQVVGLPVHADNTAATAAGLTAGAFYHSGDGMVRVVF
ncbi:MAG: hypothetical protein ACPGTO_00025 [Polaribacter sp.]